MKYLIEMMYDGTHLNGYATQPNKNTVQDKIELALSKIFNTKVKTFGSSRTDARVHAYTQFATFENEKEIPVTNIKKAVNSLVKPYIYIKNVQVVDEKFNSRYDVATKTYKYYIDKEYNPFNLGKTYHIKHELNVNEMKKASVYLLGEHDFTSFCNVNTDVIDKVRIIHQLRITETENQIIFEINGNGFLYNMIRIIVGTLLEVGRGKRSSDEIKIILKAKNRNCAGPTVAPEGLVLYQINFKEE